MIQIKTYQKLNKKLKKVKYVDKMDTQNGHNEVNKAATQSQQGNTKEFPDYYKENFE